MTPEILAQVTVVGMIFTLGGSWALVKAKGDDNNANLEKLAVALRKESEEKISDLRAENSRMDGDLREIRRAFNDYKDMATARREELTERLHRLEMSIAGSDGAYKAINDRFTNLERTVQDGFKGIREEMSGRTHRRSEET